ncbi:MAG TPA: protocatechuate 3,4-dioxygenase [Sphingomicrobium sp.]|nr:protocatechuate 3,4-dioxygenase [Sphingomicrobium sp.]
MIEKMMLSRRVFAGAGLASAGLVLASSARALNPRPLTAESAMGPFYPLDMPADSDADLTWLKGHAKRAAGQVIEISGRVLDVHGNAIPGAGIILWQANAAGRYVHPSDISKAPLDPNFHGIASLKADSKGEWRIVTIKPGGYDSPIGHRPPHIHFDVRGQRHRNIAQLYFPEEAEGNAKDSLYKMLGAEAATSVAVRNGGDPGKYAWDIVLMG